MAVLVAIVLAVAFFQLTSEDGIPGEVFLLLLGEDTAYAPGYSSSKFRSLHVGDSAAEVRMKLGKPLVITGDEKIGGVFFYSQSPSSTHYRLRAFWIESGRIEEVISEVYVD
jgi:hypothetical protein